ncbi:Dolichyl-phosphate-mannose--protein mannosyltransferase 6 [Candida viswanathii]|uniref:Dolichyl-phosphate-mannose--protein mannosyltransferase n=2 Tax=Candida viswanathii TaxID=5486 RepID=A0A367Y2C8_9ASCO|nr:Dolichyl-phosphate-mannose--protein mannosyltransferase 6 [Candida viswanathii]
MSGGYSTAISPRETEDANSIHKRNQQTGSDDQNASATQGNDTEIDEIIDKTAKLNISSKRLDSLGPLFVKVLNPLFLTSLSAFIRLYRIERANSVIWDEAHFGEFGSRYLKREFYFDVHPPLGKLLIALSGYLAGYDGSFKFDSGTVYGDEVNYVFMRIFNSFFGILVTPLAYRTAILLGFGQLTCWLVALMVVFEQLSLTLSKFILLDSMLLFFTVFTFFGLVNLHKLSVKNDLISKRGVKWFVLTGFGIGCVCSVKWVGLFATAVVGLYTIYDLLIKFYQTTTTTQMTWKVYLVHWIMRVVCLILLPMSIYIAAFKVHFAVLNHSGPGDGSISTLLQASLVGTDLQSGPRSVAFGSLVTMRSQGLSPNLLHSHHHKYPEGSQEQQVTTYGFKDENNEFLIEFDVASGLDGRYATLEDENITDSDYRVTVKDRDTIRISHKLTGCYLRANSVPAPVTPSHFEVSCFGDVESNDYADEWIIEIQSQEQSPAEEFQSEDANVVHPISTNFRLKHKQLGCYLATTGKAYPAWGYGQGETVCKLSIFSRDKNTWWNVEKHVNDRLPVPAAKYVPPKPKFWKEFVLLNYGMMAANGALVPDPDRFDKLSSEWWEWPILHSGLRMCGWGADDIKFFLLGNPLVTWLSTLGLILFLFYTFAKGFCYQRQVPSDSFVEGSLLFLGWLLHYIPFIFMGRVKYIHHYLPAQYFAIFVFGFVVDKVVSKSYVVRFVFYASLYVSILASFWYFRDLSLGMEGPSLNFRHMKLLSSWMI